MKALMFHSGVGLMRTSTYVNQQNPTSTSSIITRILDIVTWTASRNQEGTLWLEVNCQVSRVTATCDFPRHKNNLKFQKNFMK